MHYGDDYKYLPITSKSSGLGVEIREDLYMYTNQIANICIVGSEDHFVLVDAGMPKSGGEIISLIKERYRNKSPKAIILTHGHFDHVGGLIELIDEYNVPVYAHELEIPFLTGVKSYPKPDASVEGGIVAKISPLFPHEPINLGNKVHSLPSDGTVPHLDDFRWIHTPGHSPGHVSLFKESDHTLIVGDAFITVKQDELYAVLTQKKGVYGPPRYLTNDWETAKHSIEKLYNLQPTLAVTGHGVFMSGAELTNGLQQLVVNFDQASIPDHGKYVD